MRTKRRRVEVLAAIVIVATSTLTVPVLAQASTITFAGDVMTIEGTDAVNGLDLSPGCAIRSGACVTVSSLPLAAPSDPLSFPPDRCSPFGPFVECDRPTKVVAMLLGGDDRFTTGVIAGLGSELHGGAGADSLVGGVSDDDIFGDAGDDYLGGNSGDDLLDGGEGNDALDSDLTDVGRTAGSDVYVGGPGSGDYVSYGPRADALTISLDDTANDGGVGERDNAMADVEGIFGGRAADTLIGNDGANSLSGGVATTR